jgi:hypothetical protein
MLFTSRGLYKENSSAERVIVRLAGARLDSAFAIETLYIICG